MVTRFMEPSTCESTTALDLTCTFCITLLYDSIIKSKIDYCKILIKIHMNVFLIDTVLQERSLSKNVLKALFILT